MQAIILAAGMGKRLKELTKNSTKCMVRVNGVTLIERMLTQLDKLRLKRIVIVVGYKAEELKNYIRDFKTETPIMFVSNEVYYETNNIYSLYLARSFLTEDDTILLESDLIFSDGVLDILIENHYPSLALVAKYEAWMDGTTVTLDNDNYINGFYASSDLDHCNLGECYKTVNIYKFSKNFSAECYVPFLEAYCRSQGNNDYYEQVLKVITRLDRPEIKALALGDEEWYEIDDAQDLDIAESIFASTTEDKLQKMQKRYGGYWRYPRILDYCYLVNPFFPPEKLLAEIKSNFDRLFAQYPSGQDVNRLLAAKYFEVDKEQILVGNGASELIKALFDTIAGKTGIVLPTFEEYPNRLQDSVIEYIPDNSDYSYTVDDLIKYFSEHSVENMVLINPDNPSGNYIKRADVMKLASWCRNHDIRLVLDESFADFSSEGYPQSQIISKDILDEFPNIIIIKSISKSYGVPGLRLGVMVSNDIKLVKHIEKKLAVWNINSYGEYFLQIFEKYKPDYMNAIKKFILERQVFIEKLRSVKQLRILPTEANYVMCELVSGATSKQLAERLLDEHHILIKNLDKKRGINGRQFIRMAIKTADENSRLIVAIKTILGESD